MVHASNMKGSCIDGPPYDLVCVGFGPASLSIAVALHDQQLSDPTVNKRVLFLERQTAFAWHAGMLLPGSRMQISYLKDMATFRDPRSHFTFLNYLHSAGRLVTFANLGTHYPLREEFNDYLSWCAGHFVDVVAYGQEVVGVSPTNTDGQVKSWRVAARNVATGETTAYVAKHIIIAIGGSPKIPAQFPQRLYNQRVMHSSAYSLNVPRLLPQRDASYRIAIIGGGQSAVEIFVDLQSRFLNAHTTLFVRQSTLKPSDDSPFVNEIFDPDRVDPFFSLPAATRHARIRADQATNYSVVRLELLEHVYNTMYRQRLRSGADPRNWAHRIVAQTEVVSVFERPGGKVDLQLRSAGTSATPVESTTDDAFDLVIFGTGYVRNAHLALLKDAEPLFRGDCTVDRRYRVQFRDGSVARDSGIWLQGCCEATHGLSDSLLSILAVRGGKMVDAIFGEQTQHVPPAVQKQQLRAQL